MNNTNRAQVQELASGGVPTVKNNSGIDMGALIDEYKISKSYVEQYTRDFIQLDNLVDGAPLSFNNDVPFVGDTTLAGLVRSIPRDSLEQLPVCSVTVNGSKNNIPALICTYLVKSTTFNEDTFGKGLLSTLQLGAEQALTHGYAPFKIMTGTIFEDFGTTVKLLHYSDTSPEPGIQDHNETGYDYTVAHLTASRVKKILAGARNNPNTTWNVAALEQVLAATPRATNYSQYESQPKQNQAGEASSPTYEFISRNETGSGSTIITFCPEVSEMPLRVMDNNSKFGYPRVMYLVIDPAALTPFGTSRVRLASPNQNLANIYYGHIAAMLLLNSAPPIFKRGRFTSPIQLRQNAVWESNDPQATVELMNLDNGSLDRFPEMSQQIAGQIQNIMGGRTLTINSGSKGSGFSKTAPGVKQAQDFMDSGTNQITKILENFLRQAALVGLDTLLSEQIGSDDLIVDDETKDSINELAPGTVGDNNKIKMEWETFYAAIEQWSVEISVSLSKDDLEDKERGDLQDMLVVLAQNAKDNPEAAQKVTEITDLLLKKKAPLIAKNPTPAPAPEVAPSPVVTPTPASAPALTQ